MNAKKTVACLIAIRTALDGLIEQFSEEFAVAASPSPTPEKVSISPAVPATAPAAPVSSGEDDLDSMTYAEIKKIAAEIGVVGRSKELLVEGIRKAREVGVIPPSTAVPAEKADVPSKDKIRQFPSASKAASKAPVEEPEDPVYKEVVEAVADMTLDEIGNTLISVGITPKGKRESLIALLVQAVKDKKLSMGEEEEEEEEPTAPATAANSDDEAGAEEELSFNDRSNADMTDERRAALDAYDTETRQDFDSKQIDRASISEWLTEYDSEEYPKALLKKMTDAEILTAYIEASSLMIDDSGEFVEEGAYTVNGYGFCCGHMLEYNESDGSYHCSICNGDYSFEE